MLTIFSDPAAQLVMGIALGCIVFLVGYIGSMNGVEDLLHFRRPKSWLNTIAGLLVMIAVMFILPPKVAFGIPIGILVFIYGGRAYLSHREGDSRSFAIRLFQVAVILTTAVMVMLSPDR